MAHINRYWNFIAYRRRNAHHASHIYARLRMGLGVLLGAMCYIRFENLCSVHNVHCTFISMAYSSSYLSYTRQQKVYLNILPRCCFLFAICSCIHQIYWLNKPVPCSTWNCCWCSAEFAECAEKLLLSHRKHTIASDTWIASEIV